MLAAVSARRVPSPGDRLPLALARAALPRPRRALWLRAVEEARAAGHGPRGARDHGAVPAPDPGGRRGLERRARHAGAVRPDRRAAAAQVAVLERRWALVGRAPGGRA